MLNIIKWIIREKNINITKQIRETINSSRIKWIKEQFKLNINFRVEFNNIRRVS